MCHFHSVCIYIVHEYYAMLIRPNLKQNQNDKPIANSYASQIIQLTRVPKNDWFKSPVQMKRKSCESICFYLNSNSLDDKIS